tara:strand:- start:188 stop:916 length:729 start_codon:yes stop_codon:yes gene_type:complete
MDNLILIPARGGSTRVKNKNIKLLGSVPLICHSILTSLEVPNSRVIVSSDDDEIISVSEKYGAETPFKRPDKISKYDSPSIDVIMHTLKWLKENEKYEPKLVIFKPPTNPFISSDSINKMIEIIKNDNLLSSIVSITKPISHPFKSVSLDGEGFLDNSLVSINGKNINDFEMSQEWPECYEGSPACRISRVDYFKKLNLDSKIPPKTYNVENAKGFLIANEEAIDIDEKEDFNRAEILLKNL